MAITTRDLFFILRAKDEATSVFGKVANDIGRLGAAAEVASARAQAAALRQQAANLRAVGATRDEIDEVEQSAAAWEQHAQSLERSYQQHVKMTNALKSTGQGLMLAGGALVAFGGAVDYMLLSTTKDAAAYQQQVAYTKTQVDGFSASMKQLSDIGKNVAENIAVPFQEVQPALYNIFSSTNANLQQATNLLTAFAKASVAGQVSIDEASKGTMTILNALSIPFDQVTHVLDVQFQLVRKGVGQYSDFNNVLGRILPSAARAGQSLDTVAAVLTFLTRNGLSAANAATSGARALDALSNPKTLTNLKALGVQVADVHGNFLPLVDILTQMQDKLNGLSDTAKSQFLADAFKGSGGTIQALRFFNDVFKPGQLQNFIGFLNDMTNSTGQFDAAYNQMADTTSAKTQILSNNWQVLKVTVGEILTPVLIRLVGWLSSIVQWFNKLPDPTKTAIVNFTLVAGAVIAIGGAILGAMGAIAWLAGALAAIGISLGTIAGIVAAVAAGIVLIGVTCYEAYKKSGPFRDLLKDLADTFKYTWDKAKEAGTGIEDAYNQHLKPTLDALGHQISKMVGDFNSWWHSIWLDHRKDLDQLKNALIDMATMGFIFIAWVIKYILLPIMHSIEDAWKTHHDLVRDLGIVLFFLALSPIVALIIAFGALLIAIGVIIAIIAVIIYAVAAFIGWIMDLIHWIHQGYNALHDFGEMLADLIEKLLGVGDKVKSVGEKVKKAAGDIVDAIKNAFGDAIHMLEDVGKQIIQGLINGIQNSLPLLGSFLGGVSSFIQDHKGPADVDRKLLFNNGRLIMQSLMSGMASMTPSLKAQLGDVTATIVQQTSPGATQVGSAGNTYNLNTTIHTNEISPQRHAAQLGQLLVGRLM